MQVYLFFGGICIVLIERKFIAFDTIVGCVAFGVDVSVTNFGFWSIAVPQTMPKPLNLRAISDSETFFESGLTLD